MHSGESTLLLAWPGSLIIELLSPTCLRRAPKPLKQVISSSNLYSFTDQCTVSVLEGVYGARGSLDKGRGYGFDFRAAFTSVGGEEGAAGFEKVYLEDGFSNRWDLGGRGVDLDILLPLWKRTT